MQCYLCGVESESKIGFIKRAHGLKLKDCCRTCEQYEHHSKPLKTIISSIWPFLACILMFWLLDNHSAFWVVVNLIFLPLAMLPSIVVHELAHAITAKIFGQNVYEIVVGQGKTLFEFKFKKVIISFKPILISGVTFFGPIIKKFFKLRMVLIVLSGPVTNLLIAECIRIFIFDGRLYVDIHTSF